MKQRWFVSLLVLTCAQATFGANRNAWRFDSALNAAYDGVIQNVVIYTQEKDEKKLRKEITEQLFFLTGTMIEQKGGADVAHAKVKIQKQEPVTGTDLIKVTYDATLLVGWDKYSQVPAGFALALPARADDAGKQEFYDTFRNTCSEDAGDSDLDVISFYYYFRPYGYACDLHKKTYSSDRVTYATMALKTSAQQSENKYPEYHKVWEDGMLAATMIFGTDKVGATGNNDQGIMQYNNMYLWLRRNFGQPTYMNHWLNANAYPGARYPDVEMHYQLSDGRKLNFSILLIGKETLQEADEQFAARYNARTQISDFVSYNGHSGFGENIRALAKMGTFTKGQYQLYLVNGCSTFMYVDDALRAAHEAANPGSKPWEFFDIITNALPAPFSALHGENALVIKAMLEQHWNYRTLLSQFHQMQRAIVIGEEDNVFQP